MNKINWRRSAQSFSTFDFSALYNNINHKKLKFVSQELKNVCFKGVSESYIAVKKFGARWVDDKNYKIVYAKLS